MGSGELGTILKHWRERATPGSVGLPTNGPRRTPGLRREELAQLAGMSVDYITRLEQGRAVNPSAQVLTALARALRLTGDERDHLFRVGDQPLPNTGQVDSHVAPGVQRMIDQLAAVPVSVCDAAWNMIAWNALWAALMGDPSERSGRRRNAAWVHFIEPSPRVWHTEQQAADFEAALVADLRQCTGRYPHDTGLRSLVADLRSASPRFAELWERHTVGRHQMAHKTLVHPELGQVIVDCDVLTVADNDLRVVLLSAPAGSEAAQKLALLAVVGTQDLSSV